MEISVNFIAGKFSHRVAKTTESVFDLVTGLEMFSCHALGREQQTGLQEDFDYGVRTQDVPDPDKASCKGILHHCNFLWIA